MTIPAVTSRVAQGAHLHENLRAAVIPAVQFDPNNPAHRRAYAHFAKHGKWTMKFETKFPKSIEQTVVAALAQHACKSEWNS